MIKLFKRVKSGQRGFSLIELMVALVIGLIILLGAAQFYQTMSSTYSHMDSLSQRQQAVRFLVDVISEDLRSLTYYGLPGDEIVETADGDDKIFTLTYSPTRLGSFYCASGEELKTLEYKFSPSTDDGSILVQPTCGSTAAGFTAAGYQALLNGIENFDIEPGFYGATGDLVRITFNSLPNEASGANLIRFAVAKRDLVIRGSNMVTED